MSQSAPDRHHGQHPFIALAVVLIAAFMILLDVSIVNVAIPSIQRELHASFAQVQFVVAGYLLAYAVLLITGGRLGDIVGRKLMFIIGVVGFTLASALCGASQSGDQIVLARVFQGLMAAMMYPQIFSIITVVIPLERRAAAFGIFGATVGLATVTGPLAGGIIIKANILGLDWRPIFLINLPIGIGAVLAALIYLPESKSPDAPRLDIPGVLIASVALFLLTYPLVEGRDAGWPWWTWAMIAGSAVALGVFFLYERTREKAGKDPLIVLSLFENRSFTAGVLLFLVFFSGLPSLFLTMNLWLQIGLGYDALKSGLTLIPFALGSGIFSGLSARLVPRFGRTVLSIGGGLLSLGIVATIFTAHQVGPGLNGPELIPALFVSGAGLGMIIAPSINFILAAVSPRQAGSASGLLTTVQQLGGAIGIAAIGVIFFGLIGANADSITADQAAGQRAQLATVGVPGPVADQFLALYRVCFHDRANEKDPSVNPPSCVKAASYRATPQQLGVAPQQMAVVGPRIGRVAQKLLVDSAVAARKRDFTDSIQGSMLYNLAVVVVACFLVFMLPSHVRHAMGPPAGE